MAHQACQIGAGKRRARRHGLRVVVMGKVLDVLERRRGF